MMNTHINDLQEQLARVCAERDALKADRDRILKGAAELGKDAKHFAERLRRHAAVNYARSGNTDEQWASALDLAQLIQGIIGRPLPDESEMSPLHPLGEAGRG